MTGPLVGRPVALPAELLARFPELAEARWRVGGLPPRVGGWMLGARTVSGITLWRTIFLAPGVRPSPSLLLHELGHVRQFARSRAFPLSYCWQSVRRGYARNPYEIEAEDFARRVLAERLVVGPAAAGRGAVDAPGPYSDSPAEGQ